MAQRHSVATLALQHRNPHSRQVRGSFATEVVDAFDASDERFDDDDDDIVDQLQLRNHNRVIARAGDARQECEMSTTTS
jgi:hypothetical protein